jgi:hypothetical protein
MHFAEIAGAFVSSARPTTSRLVPPSSGRDERLGRDVTPLPIGPATTPGRSVAIGGSADTTTARPTIRQRRLCIPAGQAMGCRTDATHRSCRHMSPNCLSARLASTSADRSVVSCRTSAVPIAER